MGTNQKIKPGIKVFLNTAKSGMFLEPEAGLNLNIFNEKSLSGVISECSEQCLERIQQSVDHGLLLLKEKDIDQGPQRINIVSAEEDMEKQCQELLSYPQQKLKQIIDKELSIEKLKLLQTLEMSNKDRKLIVKTIKSRINKLTEGIIIDEEEVEEEYQVHNIKE